MSYFSKVQQTWILNCIYKEIYSLRDISWSENVEGVGILWVSNKFLKNETKCFNTYIIGVFSYQ